MNFPRVARYKWVMTNVNKFLLEENIKSFPVDPFLIIKKNKWGLMTYTELAREQGVLIEDIIAAVQSKDGYTIFDGTNYTIAYNDTQITGRIRFTLMHEIGHIYMKHLTDFDETILARSSLTEQKYQVLENEVNSFARNVLSPVMIVKELGIKNANELINYFGITKRAAKVRLEVMINDYMNLLSPLIRFQREHFKKIIHTCIHSKHCASCSHHFIQEDATYCLICGKDDLNNRKGLFVMKYDGYKVDDIGRAIECPRCGNEEVQFEGEHCIACSLIIINKCTNQHIWNGEVEWECGTTLPGNARYCYKCGNASTFFQQDLLDSWEVEKHEKEEKEKLPF